MSAGGFKFSQHACVSCKYCRSTSGLQTTADVTKSCSRSCLKLCTHVIQRHGKGQTSKCKANFKCRGTLKFVVKPAPSLLVCVYYTGGEVMAITVIKESHAKTRMENACKHVCLKRDFGGEMHHSRTASSSLMMS